MENLEIIMDTYYSALYWRAFFYGMLIPSLVYLVFNYFTHRMIRRHFQRFEAQIRDAYNELYGNNSWNEDWDLGNSSILPGAYGSGWGNSVELLEFLPELSSPINQ